MINKDDGGPIFPREYDNVSHYGLSIRDWLAGQVLPHVWTSTAEIDGDTLATITRRIAEFSYAMADAMLEARKK